MIKIVSGQVPTILAKLELHIHAAMPKIFIENCQCMMCMSLRIETFDSWVRRSLM